MANYRSVRGNVNVILNGMIRDGVITSFETNFDNPTVAFAPHVRVAADLGVDPRQPAFDERRRELQGRIMPQLEPLAPGVIVSVRGTLAKAAPEPPIGGMASSAERPAASSGGPLRSTLTGQGSASEQ